MSNYNFPLRLVEQFNTESGISRGRRGVGTVVARGVYRFGLNVPADLQVNVYSDASGKAAINPQPYENSLRLMFSRFEGEASCAEIREELAGRELPIAFIEGHEYLLELDVRGNRLLVASDLASSATQHRTPIPQAEYRQGLEYLLALGHYCIFLRWLLGWSQRQALAKIIELCKRRGQALQFTLEMSNVRPDPMLDFFE